MSDNMERLIRSLEDQYSSACHDLIRIGVPAVEPLISELRNLSDSGRRNAAIALGQIGDVRAVEPLGQVLRNTSFPLAVAKALAKFGSAAVDSLIKALEDKRESVRESAAVALGEIRDARAVEPLIRALNDSTHRDVRRCAADSLVKIGAPAVNPLIKALEHEAWWVREGVCVALGQIGDARGVSALISALGDKQSSVIKSAADALCQIGDARAVEALISALGNEEWSVRERAAVALGQIGDAHAVGTLISLLRDGDARVRTAVAASLVKLSDGRSLQPLSKALEDKDQQVRSFAADALGQIGDARAAEPLIKAIGDPNENVRRCTVIALGKLGNVRAITPLCKALWDIDEQVCGCAAEALVNIVEPRAKESLLKAMKGASRGSAHASLLQALSGFKYDGINEPLMVACIDALQFGNAKQRAAAAESISKVNDARFIPLLLSSLEWFAANCRVTYQPDDSASRLWKAIVEGLSRFNNLPSTVILPLVKGLSCSDYVSWHAKPSVVAMLAKFAGSQEAESHTSSLVRMLRSTSFVERRDAAEAIGILKLRSSIPALIAVLGDEKDRVRAKGAWALGECADEQIVEPLVTALNSSKCEFYEASHIANALAEFPDPRAANALAALLKRCYSRIDSFYEDHSRTGGHLSWSLEDIWGAHQAAVKALERIPTTEAAEALRHKHRSPWKTD